MYSFLGYTISPDEYGYPIYDSEGEFIARIFGGLDEAYVFIESLIDG